MRTEDVFEILGIDPVKDETVIRDAYHRQLTKTNPEDDQEGFMRLRSAYEEALAYAKNREEEEDTKVDDSPSGQWVLRAASLYERFSARCDVEVWKQLFDEETFLSLDENEECRKKFLIFLMNHFNFPKEIWQLFDRKLGICADSGRLKEGFPADFVRFLVQRCTEKESMDYTLFQGPDDGNYDLFLACYRECINALNAPDHEKAEQELEKADALGIYHPYMEILRTLLYKKIKREEEAEKLLLQLRERYPQNKVMLFHLANFYWEAERKEEAWVYYQKLKELDPENYMANYCLAFYYFEKKEYERAKNCIQMIYHFGYNREMMKLLKDIHTYLKPDLRRKWEEEGDISAALELAKCSFQEECCFAASKILEAIEGQVPAQQQAEYLELLAKAYLGQGEDEKAVKIIDAWEEGIDVNCKEQQTAAAKLKMAACHNMGRGFAIYYDEAVKEYEKIKDRAEQEPNFLIEAAQIFLEKEEVQKTLDLAEILLEKHQVNYAYVLKLKAYVKLWDGAGVIACGKQCISFFPDYAYPYEEMAKVYYDTGHKEELKRLLEQAAENKIESIYLDNSVYHGEEVPKDFPINKELNAFHVKFHTKISETGKLKFYQMGYPVITKLLNMYPCNLILNKRGLFSMAAKETEAAMKDFQKILERDPADAFAFNNIGCLHKYAGEYEKALVYFKRAILYMYRDKKEEPVVTHYVNLAHTYELMGEYELAAKTYRTAYDRFGKYTYVVRGLSADYARTGQVEEARKLIEDFPCEKEQKEELLYRMYLYAGMHKKAYQCLDYLKGFVASHNLSASTAQGYFFQYNHMLAWNLLLEGKKEEGMKAIDRAGKYLGTPPYGKAKEKMDVVMNRIFFLTFQAEHIIVEHSEFQEENGKGGIALLWEKVFHGAKKKEHSKQDEEKDLTRKLQKIVYDLKMVVEQSCTKGMSDEGEGNLVATETFFYKERYVKFVEFMLALYGEGNEAGEKALKEMEESPRCRKCNQASCMRLILAKALLLEQQGKKQEAMLLYQQLIEEQPYNLYARTKLLFTSDTPVQAV